MLGLESILEIYFMIVLNWWLQNWFLDYAYRIGYDEHIELHEKYF